MQSRYLTAPHHLKLPRAALIGKFVKKHKLPLWLVVLHAPLGLLLMNAGGFSVVHPYAVLFFGLYLALRKRVRIEEIAPVAAYIVGAEVLWRMSEAPIYWEFGKYSAGLILIAALAVRDKWKIPSLPLLYFVFLLPACFLTVMTNNVAEAKDKLSFNMSGPLLLFVCCWFFSHVRLNWPQLRRVLFWLVVPLVSVAVTTLFYTVTVENIRFTTESNVWTSGGFGPNQVSAVLGLGSFVCFVCYMLFKNRPQERLIFVALAVFLMAQSVMTFSRGGIYNAAGALMILLLFLMRRSGRGVRHLLSIVLIAAFFMLAIFPRMNEFTGGTLEARFANTEPTGRYEIARADFMIFLENPVWGIGAGESFNYREKFYKKQAAHTEFSRLIAEHGTFGIFALLLLAASGFFIIRRQKTTLGRALVASFIAWSSLFMINTGMRLAAPAFIWGMSFIVLTGWQERKRWRHRLKIKNEIKARPQ